VRVGEWLQVLPGEKILLMVKWLLTTVDESMLTGEPVPVIKQPGDVSRWDTSRERRVAGN